MRASEQPQHRQVGLPVTAVCRRVDQPGPAAGVPQDVAAPQVAVKAGGRLRGAGQLIDPLDDLMKHPALGRADGAPVDCRGQVGLDAVDGRRTPASCRRSGCASAPARSKPRTGRLPAVNRRPGAPAACIAARPRPSCSAACRPAAPASTKSVTSHRRLSALSPWHGNRFRLGQPDQRRRLRPNRIGVGRGPWPLQRRRPQGPPGRRPRPGPPRRRPEPPRVLPPPGPPRPCSSVEFTRQTAPFMARPPGVPPGRP